MRTIPFSLQSQRAGRGRFAFGMLTLMVPMGCARAGEAQPGADLAAMSLEDLIKIKVETVSSVSRHIQPITQAPSSVTIVTSDEIRKYGYRSLADILGSGRQPGAFSD